MLYLQNLESPLGAMLAGATNKGICLLSFADNKKLPKQLEALEAYAGAPATYSSHVHLDALNEQLAAYFDRRRQTFEIPIDQPGTTFQQGVWQALTEDVPFGLTRSYGWLAKRLGDIKAVRAVAAANGANRCAIIVPCHRIVGATGKLTGYAGGLERKKKLLAHEGNGLPF